MIMRICYNDTIKKANKHNEIHKNAKDGVQIKEQSRNA